MNTGKDLKASLPAAGLLLICGFIFLFTLDSLRAGRGIPSASIAFPSLIEIRQNLALLIQGYGFGYGRSLWGYLMFFLMALFFLAAGGLILEFLFKPQGAQGAFNAFEWTALSYILGSLAASLLWLGLGAAGFLSRQTAWMACLLGALLGFVYFRKKNPWKTAKEALAAWRNLPFLEKGLACCLIAYFLLSSAIGVYPPLQGDALATHAALPNFYINMGEVFVYPGHFHSAFPENTEMLVLWALLLDSEFAAFLVVWGFYLALSAMVIGFVKRWADSFSALLSGLILAFSPVVLNTLYIKNDIPTASFVLAGICAFARAYEGYFAKEGPSLPPAFIFLSGLLFGGAVGHKLHALGPAFIGSICVLFVDLAFRGGKRPLFFPAWILGILIATAPWLLRSYRATGNPIYPFFSRFFGSSLPATAFFAGVEGKFGHPSQGLSSLMNFLSSLGGLKIYSWGPSLSLMLLCPLVFIGKYPANLKLSLAVALLSWMLLLHWTVEARFAIGLIAFIVCLTFGLIWRSARASLSGVPARAWIAGLLVFSAAVTYSNASLWSPLVEPALRLICGNPPDEFPPRPGIELEMYHHRWLSHVINTRSPAGDAFLYGAINYPYGLKRKFIFSGGQAEQILFQMAKQSPDAAAMAGHMRVLGVQHLIIKRAFFFDQFDYEPWSLLKVGEHERLKVRDLVQNHMTLAFSTPKGGLLWFSLKDRPKPQIFLGRADALEFPSMILKQARFLLASGRSEEAASLARLLEDLPVSPSVKLKASEILAEAGKISYNKKPYSRLEVEEDINRFEVNHR